MKFKLPLAIALSATLLQVYSAAQAEERREERREERGRANPPPRPAPPRFQEHPPGAHPHGPMVTPARDSRYEPPGCQAWRAPVASLGACRIFAPGLLLELGRHSQHHLHRRRLVWRPVPCDRRQLLRFWSGQHDYR
jgi:hypothetical protein